MQGIYDETDNLHPMMNSIDVQNCYFQSNITLQSGDTLNLKDGIAIMESYYFENEVSGPCISNSPSGMWSFDYINSSSLEFFLAGTCGNPIVTLNSQTQFKVPICNGDNGTWEGYSLWEKQ